MGSNREQRDRLKGVHVLLALFREGTNQDHRCIRQVIRDYENLREQHKILANTKHKCVKENKELRTRVAEQEKLIEWHKTDTHDAMEWKNELQTRLSTLLKASEGMEKALVCMIEDAEELRIINRRNIGERRDEKINSTYYAEIEKAKSVLADFRAVKEGK